MNAETFDINTSKPRNLAIILHASQDLITRYNEDTFMQISIKSLYQWRRSFSKENINGEDIIHHPIISSSLPI